MAAKKSGGEKVCFAVFEDGPRDGEDLRLVSPPPPYVKLAFPDWCVYVRREKVREAKKGYLAQYRFEYVGTDVPDELKKQGRSL